MATSAILLYVLHAFVIFGFLFLTAWLYYRAGDDCLDRGGYLFLGTCSNIATLALFAWLVYRLTINSLAA